jgi:thiol-disulfide isomerase/thioredoxin
MKPSRILLAAIFVGVVAASVAILATDKLAVNTTKSAALQQLDGELPSFQGAIEWLNTPPLSAADLRGKVVLVNFWTFTCINWLRQLPYVRAWAKKYKDQGLVVIGVHTPEFVFEQEIDHVRRATKDMNIDYPVAVDSRYTIWRAFNNHYWPALYFVDAQGHMRHHQFGEGEYEQSERMIQQLLAEAGAGRGDQGLVALDARGSEAAADWRNLKSPENYLGYARTGNFVPVGGIQEDRPNLYRGFPSLPLNWWSLMGVWTVGEEFASLIEASGRITYRFHARDLHLVMAPSMPESMAARPVRFRVTLDGMAPGAGHGADVDAEGWGTLQEGRLYQLIRQSGPIADRTFEIEFMEPGVRAYAFTFG